MKDLFRAIRFAPVLAALICLAAVAPSFAQTIEQRIHTTENRLTEAKRARLNLIAPRSFEEAQKELEGVIQRFEKGGKIEDIEKRLARVDQKLDRCDDLREIGDVILRDSFTARDDAIAANAPEFAAELWTEAEKTIRNAGRKIEDGNQNSARNESNHAAGLFRDAELLAIRADILGNTKKERERALELEANKLAANTMAGAERDLQSAERILQGDRYMKAQARELATSARNQFRRAARIAEQATRIDRDREGAPETLILAYEEQVARIAGTVDYTPEFAEGVEPVVDQVVAAVKSLAEDREQLVQEVTELRSEMDKMNDTLALLQDRDQELQRKERHDRKLREVREMFAANEAEVLLGEDQLIIRLYGLSFPVNSSEIRPENFGLLTRLQRALREFPLAAIGIEGHTDSQGDENLNQSLSNRRAEAVREYLVANMGVESDRILARGYGESRPIANNETESGRARNRRIDVVVDMSKGSM